MKFSKIMLALASLIFLSGTAIAYIDPGTGSMILGSIGPLIGLVLAAIAGFFLRRFITPVKKFFIGHKIVGVIIVIVVIAALILALFLLIK